MILLATKTLARRGGRNLSKLAKKNKKLFLFCLHFIGDKNQTLARRREFESNWLKRTKKLFLFLFCLHFIGDKNQTLAWRRGRNLSQIGQKEQKNCFCFVYILLATKIKHWHGGGTNCIVFYC
jgi:hypothetical protein